MDKSTKPSPAGAFVIDAGYDLDLNPSTGPLSTRNFRDGLHGH